jgi:hypothetical protein
MVEKPGLFDASNASSEQMVFPLLATDVEPLQMQYVPGPFFSPKFGDYNTIDIFQILGIFVNSISLVLIRAL